MLLSVNDLSILFLVTCIKFLYSGMYIHLYDWNKSFSVKKLMKNDKKVLTSEKSMIL